MFSARTNSNPVLTAFAATILGLCRPSLAPAQELLLALDRPESAAAPAAPDPAPRGACTYAHDDGSPNSYFLSTSLNGWDVGAIHRFDAQPGCQAITSISVSWSTGGSSPPVGTPARIHVWDDPDDDGNPINAVLLTTQSVTVQGSTFGEMEAYSLDTPVEVEGVYFVGASIVANTAWPVGFMPIDTSSPYVGGRAWVMFNPGVLNVLDLNQNSLPPTDVQNQVGFGLYFLLRAEGGPVQEIVPITYQGRLNQDGAAVNGSVDLRFSLYDADIGGNQIDGPVEIAGVAVVDGLFTAYPPFLLQAFTTDPLWVEIQVAAPSGSSYTTLSPRQPLTPAPQAYFAERAGTVNWLNIQDKPFFSSLDASDGSPTGALLVDVNGRVGIGTASPNSQLHVNVNSAAGAPALRVQVDASTKLVVQNNGGTAIGSNVTLPPVNGLYVAGDTGLGTATPEAKLHVMTGSAGTVTAHGSSSAVFESNGPNFLSLLSPSPYERGIVFGSNDDNQHGGIYYFNGSGLRFHTGGDLTRMTINAAGNVGIGTTTPSAKLHVGGTAGVDGIRFPDGTLQTTAALGGSADGHSLDASDGSPVDALFVDAAGSVGIGTATPEAPLHVLSGTAGTVTAHASSAAVLERSTSNFLSLLAPDASERGVAFGSPANAVHGGMYYSNATGLSLRTGGNNTRLRIDSSGLVGIGSGTPAARLHVVDATGGNSSVILPSNAIGAAEILDEPGAAESEFDQPQIALDGSLQTLLSTTITAPDTGFVLVIASAQCSFNQHVNGTTSDANFGVSNNAASLPTNQDVELLISNAAPTGVYRFPVTVHALFPVLAGARTFYFLGQELSGNAFAQDIQLTAVFLPTAYGTAGFQGDEPGAGDEDDPDSARDPLTPEEIEWERAEAIRLNEERIIREREQLAAEVEELRALRRELETLRDDLTGDADQADDQADE